MSIKGLPVALAADERPSHPDWCSSAACTAYIPDGDELHRSEPIVVKTDDPAVALYISKVAASDGSDEHIELMLLAATGERPWHLTEPLHGREIILPLDRADAVRHALAVLG